MQKSLPRRVIKNRSKPRTIPSARGRSRTKNALGLTERGERRFLRQLGLSAEVVKRLGPGFKKLFILELRAQNKFLQEKGLTVKEIKSLNKSARTHKLAELGYHSPVRESENHFLANHGFTRAEITAMTPLQRDAELLRLQYLKSGGIEGED